MELIEHANRELNMILAKCKEPEEYELQLQINNNILDLIREFSMQRHSGISAGYVIELLYGLLQYKPLGPLTGEDSEWKFVPGTTEEYLEQNIRYTAVFRENGDNSTAYNIEGKIFTDNGGKTWYISKESIVPVTFPYIVPVHPEEVYITKTEQETENE